MLKNSIRQKAFRKIKRLEKCEGCGAEKVRLVRHHSDYNKPLDVIIFCDTCHYKWHKENKTIERNDYKKRDRIGITKIVLDIELEMKFEDFLDYGGYLLKNKINRNRDLINHIQSCAKEFKEQSNEAAPDVDDPLKGTQA